MNEEEYIEYTKDVLKSSKEELPTLKLQLISLVRFMRAAGYEPVDPENPIRFKLVEANEGYPLDVNIVNAVHLHNYGFFYHTTQGYVIPDMIRMTGARLVLWQACKEKVVREIYLQWSKRRKEWIVNKHRIKFVEAE